MKSHPPPTYPSATVRHTTQPNHLNPTPHPPNPPRSLLDPTRSQLSVHRVSDMLQSPRASRNSPKPHNPPCSPTRYLPTPLHTRHIQPQAPIPNSAPLSACVLPPYVLHSHATTLGASWTYPRVLGTRLRRAFGQAPLLESLLCM